jgi:hypothetical protein
MNSFCTKFLQILKNFNLMKKNKIALMIFPIVILGGVMILFNNETNIETIPENRIIQDEMLKEIELPEIKTDEEIENEITQSYENLEQDYDTSEYKILPREWQNSGPFSIDRQDYALGEKIFFRADGLKVNDVGDIVILKPLNQTHYKVWQTYPFDGNQVSAFNIYFEPVLSKTKLICEKNQLIGDWRIVFKGTEYENIGFTIYDQIVTGDEDKFSEKVC